MRQSIVLGNDEREITKEPVRIFVISGTAAHYECQSKPLLRFSSGKDTKVVWWFLYPSAKNRIPGYCFPGNFAS
jgi:hypothetical protein